VFEKNYYSIDSIELILLSGIPKEWFVKEKELSILNAPILSGTISIIIIYENNQIKVDIKYVSNKIYKNETFKIIIPFKAKSFIGLQEKSLIKFAEAETIFSLVAQNLEMSLEI
jgi:hypothetical protein